MTNPYTTEKELFNKLNMIQVFLETLRRDLAAKTKQKAQKIQVPLSKDLQQKCQLYLSTGGRKNFHECKICHKIFDDGRKLGGHVSRSHKNYQNQGLKTLGFSENLTPKQAIKKEDKQNLPDKQIQLTQKPIHRLSRHWEETVFEQDEDY